MDTDKQNNTPKFLSSGNEIVDTMQSINIYGNIIAPRWLKTIITKKGKPDLKAILLLAEIVYWYKPKIITDKDTGEIIAIKKRFKHDLLQKSYLELAIQFNFTKREVMNAISRLEELKVIEKVFRTQSICGVRMNNILYIKLIPDKLFELTYNDVPHLTRSKEAKNEDTTPEKEPSSTNGSDNQDNNSGGCNFEKGIPTTTKSNSSSQKEATPPAPKSETNTEAITTDLAKTPTQTTTNTTSTSKEKIVVDNLDLFKKYKACGISYNYFTKYINIYGLEAMQKQYVNLENQIKKGTNIRNLAGWLINALKNDYNDPIAEEAKKHKKAKQKGDENTRLNKQALIERYNNEHTDTPITNKVY